MGSIGLLEEPGPSCWGVLAGDHICFCPADQTPWWVLVGEHAKGSPEYLLDQFQSEIFQVLSSFMANYSKYALSFRFSSCAPSSSLKHAFQKTCCDVLCPSHLCILYTWHDPTMPNTSGHIDSHGLNRPRRLHASYGFTISRREGRRWASHHAFPRREQALLAAHWAGPKPWNGGASSIGGASAAKFVWFALEHPKYKTQIWSIQYHIYIWLQSYNILWIIIYTGQRRASQWDEHIRNTRSGEHLRMR